MNDDGIIRSEHPHEVVMPEGSRVAVSKTAEQTQPSVRKVFQEGEEFIDAHLIIEQGGDTSSRNADETVAFAKDETVHQGPALQTDRIDNQKAEARSRARPRQFRYLPALKMKMRLLPALNQLFHLMRLQKSKQMPIQRR